MARSHKGRRGVKSDETLFSIVEYLREVDGAGVTELADELGMAKSSVHDHLSTMRDHDFVVKRGDTYHLGLQFFNYGQYVRTRCEVYEAARPVVDDLVGRVDEMVWLMTHENGRVMYLYGRAGKTDVDETTIVGSWAYMHCNSGGKAILAHLSDEAVDDVVERHGLPARTPNTITDPEELREELADVREQGYALNLGEDIGGIHAVGVPIRFEEEIEGALAIAGPAHRVDRERCETELAEQLFASTDEIEVNLAYA